MLLAYEDIYLCLPCSDLGVCACVQNIDIFKYLCVKEAIMFHMEMLGNILKNILKY